jgi:3-oxoacyl-[acyl-carrier-protein] synthase II
MKRRAVVTGIGVVSPLGHDRESTWSAVCRGESAVGPITLFDASAFPTRIAAEVKDWQEGGQLDRKLRRMLNRGAEFILYAAESAWTDSGLRHKPIAGTSVGVVAAHSGARPDPESVAWLCTDQDRAADILKVSPLDTMRGAYHTIGTALACRFRATGPNMVLSTACASGSQAIGLAMRLIRDGEADIMIAAGGDAMIAPFDVLAFCAIGALSTRNDDPQHASRPFDAQRDGFVLGEGAAVLILEEREHALSRGARIYGEVRGYGSSLNAYRVTDSPPDGYGPALAMTAALADAGLTPGEVQYVNAHGTSTRDNDTSETTAIKHVFGNGSADIPVSSTKGATGHLISGAGSIEAAFCLLAMRDSVLPPTANLEKADPACDLNYLPCRPAYRAVDVCLSNSFGFGGTNASLVLTRN